MRTRKTKSLTARAVILSVVDISFYGWSFFFWSSDIYGIL